MILSLQISLMWYLWNLGRILSPSMLQLGLIIKVTTRVDNLSYRRADSLVSPRVLHGLFIVFFISGLNFYSRFRWKSTVNKSCLKNRSKTSKPDIKSVCICIQSRVTTLDYRLDLATRSSSSFFLIAYELLDPCNQLQLYWISKWLLN